MSATRKVAGILKRIPGRREIRFGLMGAVVTLALTGGVLGIQSLRERFAFEQARTQLEAGYPFLAAETLEPVREGLVGTSEHCALLSKVYLAAGLAERLHWTAESCMYENVQTAEVYLAKALAFEISGNEPQAVTFLTRAAPMFPELYYKLALLHDRVGRKDQARVALNHAVEKRPEDYQLTLDALQYFLNNGADDDAKKMAERLKDLKDIKDPEVKLVIARGLLRGGDTAGARRLAEEAKLMMAAEPERGVELQKTYEDVLKP